MQWAVGVFCVQREFVVQRGQQARCVPDILKFVEKVVNVASNAAGAVAVAYAVGQDYASDVIAAREDGGEVAATVGA
jgi:hypothetical protein